jgi:hypothetical protein
VSARIASAHDGAAGSDSASASAANAPEQDAEQDAEQDGATEDTSTRSRTAVGTAKVVIEKRSPASDEPAAAAEDESEDKAEDNAEDKAASDRATDRTTKLPRRERARGTAKVVIEKTSGTDDGAESEPAATARAEREPAEPEPAETDAAEARPRPARSPAARAALAALAWATPLVAGALGVFSLVTADAEKIGQYGLVSALTPVTAVALILLQVSFVVSATGARPRQTLLALHVVILVVLLAGAPAMVEDGVGRFSTAYTHLGFAEYIGRTGDVLAEADARFSWPGFFAALATVFRLAGVTDPLTIVAWTPTVVNLLLIAPVLLVARAVLGNGPRAWVAVWLFMLADWIGQDYLAPQALAIILLVSVAGLLLTYFRPGAAREGSQVVVGTAVAPRGRGLRRLVSRLRAIARRWVQNEEPIQTEPTSTRIFLFVALLLIGCAMIVSHQLTPVAMIFAVGMLVLLKRCTLTTLPVLLGVAMAAWVSYAAAAYWSGHLESIFGSVGKVGDTVDQSITKRATGADARQIVLMLRLGTAALVWTVGGIGILRQLRSRLSVLTVTILAAAPVPLVVLQPYGGEGPLRVYLYALAFVSVLCVVAFLPRRWQPDSPPRLPSRIALAAFCCVLVALFPLARFGNEGFERIRAPDVSAVRWFYGNAQDGAPLVALTDSAPIGYRDIDTHPIGYIPEVEVDKPDGIVRSLTEDFGDTSDGGPTPYLVITKTQFDDGSIRFGLPADWGTTLLRGLDRQPQLRKVYSRDGAWVYVLVVKRDG